MQLGMENSELLVKKKEDGWASGMNMWIYQERCILSVHIRWLEWVVMVLECVYFCCRARRGSGLGGRGLLTSQSKWKGWRRGLRIIGGGLGRGRDLETALWTTSIELSPRRRRRRSTRPSRRRVGSRFVELFFLCLVIDCWFDRKEQRGIWEKETNNNINNIQSIFNFCQGG